MHALARTEAPAPLLDHDTAFLVDLLGLERHRVRPILQNLEPGLQNLRIVRRHAQRVHGFVERREGVDAGAEAHPDRFEVVDQRLLLEVLGAVEGHVLDEVCQAALVVILEHRAHIHDEPQLRPVLRLIVGAHVVREAVGQAAQGHGWIHRDHALPIRTLPGHQRRGRRQAHHEQHENGEAGH